MRIALDNNCPSCVIKKLEKNGHTVVLYARHEMDEDWVSTALSLGADLFISNDLDIVNMLDRWNESAAFIELPQRVSGYRLSEWIVKQVKLLAA
jgi:hypothetical protein